MKVDDIDNPDRDYNGLMKLAVSTMMTKLLENSHKEGFDKKEMWELEADLGEERHEVDIEIDRVEEAETEEEQIHAWTLLMRELADEMNVCAMMLLRGERIIKILESKKRKELKKHGIELVKEAVD